MHRAAHIRKERKHGPDEPGLDDVCLVRFTESCELLEPRLKTLLRTPQPVGRMSLESSPLRRGQDQDTWG